MNTRRSVLVGILFLALTTSAGAQTSAELTTELYRLDLDRLNNDRLPRLIEVHAKVEAMAHRGDPQAARLIKYVVLLRQLAQLQDPRRTVLTNRTGEIRGVDPKAEITRVRSALDDLRAGRPPRVTLPAEPTAPQPDRVRRLLNRELSFLAFNERVLAQAADKSVPPLERLRFLTIASSNMDEFFQVRVSGLQEEVAAGRKAPRADGYAPGETLTKIRAEAKRLVAEQYRLLNQEVLPELKRRGIAVDLDGRGWDAKTRAETATAFQELNKTLRVVPIEGALPHVTDRSLNLLVTLSDGKRAVIQVPASEAEMRKLPSGRFVTTTAIVREHAAKLFPGAEVKHVSPFRVTRNSDLWGRTGVAFRYGDAARLEIERGIPASEQEFLRRELKLNPKDVAKVAGPVDLKRLGPVIDADPKLTYERPTPTRPANLPEGANLFEAIAKGDVLLHHPFQAYDPVVEFLQQAAKDPKVEGIRQTLYRTGNPQEGVVEALVTAAKNGKDVRVLVETRARFDELNNSKVTKRLTEAGAKVVFGPPGLKTHAKATMVERREGRTLRRYVHLGTGNYNPGTAKIYTDFSLFTRDPTLGRDVAKVFEQLGNAERKPGALKLGKLLQAPYTLQSTLMERIAHEAAEARAGRPARIVAKMNSLNDPKLIEALYAASKAGVQIDLVVRGITTLRPGVPGLSENIRVRSLIGRFLEHTRVFQFHDGGRKTTYMASADWMVRNTERRVELAFPVEDKRLKGEVDRILGAYLNDNTKAWRLGPDGRYRKVEPKPGEARRNAQEELAARGGRSAGPGVAVDRLAPYRRADGTLDWKKLSRSTALREGAGLAHFGLALFLKEVAVVAATGDRDRIEEFFDGLLTTDFYKHYGLFVAGARLTEVAYTKYLQRHIRPGFVNGLLKTNLVLAAGLALPMIAEGTFTGKTLVISLGALGISGALVKGSISGIKWVTDLDKARKAGLLGKAASAGRLARLGGWFYTAAELAVILFVAEKIEVKVHTALDLKAAKDSVGKAGEALLAAVNDPKATPESVRGAAEAYHTAWGDYRNYLYRPLHIEEARFADKLAKMSRDAKLADDALVAAARRRADLNPELRKAIDRYTRTKEAETRAEVGSAAADAFTRYERKRADLLRQVYEGERREGTLFQDVDELPWLLDGAKKGAPNDPYADTAIPLSGALGRRRLRKHLAGALRNLPTNRLQTYEDESLVLQAVAARLRARARGDLADEVTRVRDLTHKTRDMDRALYRDGLVPAETEGARGKLRETTRAD